MFLRSIIVIIAFTILATAPKLLGAFVITGQVPGVAKCYYPRIYLAAIDDIGNISGISSRLILAQSELDSTGAFEISGDFLPADKRFYRLYFTPEKDINAHMSVGENENFVLLILNNASVVHITCYNICTSFPDFETNGMPEGNGLSTLKGWEREFYRFNNDSTSEEKRTLLRNKLLKNYREFADSSSILLSTLVATVLLREEGYAANKDFFEAFLSRLKKELPQSPYPTQFEKLISKVQFNENGKQPASSSYIVWFIITLILLLVSAGINVYLYRKLKQRTGNQLPIENEADIISMLTIKEKQILLLVDDGLSNKEIAEKLNIELSTVKSHVSRIYQKTNIQNRSQVAKIARLLR